MRVRQCVHLSRLFIIATKIMPNAEATAPLYDAAFHLQRQINHRTPGPLPMQLPERHTLWIVCYRESSANQVRADQVLSLVYILAGL